MEQQSYAKHAKYVPMFHFVLFAVIIIALGLSITNMVKHMSDDSGRTALILFVLISISLLLLFFFTRNFAMTVQDRAIRAEENLRHFALTGKLLDHRLTPKQIVGLRFASDSEFPALAQKAAESNMSLDDIKKSVKTWRPDFARA